MLTNLRERLSPTHKEVFDAIVVQKNRKFADSIVNYALKNDAIKIFDIYNLIENLKLIKSTEPGQWLLKWLKEKSNNSKTKDHPFLVASLKLRDKIQPNPQNIGSDFDLIKKNFDFIKKQKGEPFALDLLDYIIKNKGRDILKIPNFPNIFKFAGKELKYWMLDWAKFNFFDKAKEQKKFPIPNGYKIVDGQIVKYNYEINNVIFGEDFYAQNNLIYKLIPKEEILLDGCILNTGTWDFLNALNINSAFFKVWKDEIPLCSPANHPGILISADNTKQITYNKKVIFEVNGGMVKVANISANTLRKHPNALLNVKSLSITDIKSFNENDLRNSKSLESLNVPNCRTFPKNFLDRFPHLCFLTTASNARYENSSVFVQEDFNEKLEKKRKKEKQPARSAGTAHDDIPSQPAASTLNSAPVNQGVGSR